MGVSCCGELIRKEQAQETMPFFSTCFLLCKTGICPDGKYVRLNVLNICKICHYRIVGNYIRNAEFMHIVYAIGTCKNL